jgi:hypothetical protein
VRPAQPFRHAGKWILVRGLMRRNSYDRASIEQVRLLRLTRKLLKDFPRLRDHKDSADVVQQAGITGRPSLHREEINIGPLSFRLV